MNKRERLYSLLCKGKKFRLRVIAEKDFDSISQGGQRDDEWKAFRIQGTLDFSLIGILLKISCLMAENNIGIFAISTFNTDYVLIKSKNFSKAIELLSKQGIELQNNKLLRG